MKRIILIVGFLTLGAGIMFSSCSGDGSGSVSTQAQYHCPMHPTYTSDRPGDCPICGMRLVPIKSKSDHRGQGNDGEPREGRPLHYRHPMDPSITSPEPMKDEMGMDYVPVYSDDSTKNREVKSTSSGRAPVEITAEREQLIGVRTEPVSKREIVNVIRASGRIAYDPELYNAIIEYREALATREKVKESPWADVRERSDALVQSAVLRLRQMGLSQKQIERLSGAESDPTNLLLSQPNGSVWVYAQVYEFEAALVKAGQDMVVKSPAFPGRTFHGKVVAVDTILDPQTRTLKVRGEVPTQGGLLKPEMYVDVEIKVNLGTNLAVPHEAVLNTGERQIVFVKTRPGFYEPREVTIGHESQKYVEVLSGLRGGEEVVTSANFLIDSESRLNAALSGAAGHVH